VGLISGLVGFLLIIYGPILLVNTADPISILIFLAGWVGIYSAATKINLAYNAKKGLIHTKYPS
jgi:hypothetical protein